ncbi:DUF1398 domain-containing protein [Flavobacterium sp.]|uniref:DUF1398 domain-containing protein n=1 Tax=Flavobacterium sp. TaxID=239 RepID=UPI00352963BC
MFTVAQIKEAYGKVKSGADFPKYIQEIKALGVVGFETFVNDSHTVYFGNNDYKTASVAMYENKKIATVCNKDNFVAQLKKHQQGATDYFTFCQDCAENGIEKWIVSLTEMTCIYYDTQGNEVLVEQIPE